MLFITPVFAEGIHLSAGASTKFVNYSEFSVNGRELNQESGWLPGVSLCANYSDLRIGLSLCHQYFSNDISYDGETQGGSPLKTETATRLAKTEISISTGLVSDYFDLGVSLSSEVWDRQILGTATTLPLDEEYRWKNFSLFVRTDFEYIKSRKFDVYMAYFLPFDDSLEVDLRALGFGQPDIDLAFKNYFKAGFGMDLFRFDRALIRFGTEFTYRKSDASEPLVVSNGATVATLTEPASETQHLEFNVSVRFRF